MRCSIKLYYIAYEHIFLLHKPKKYVKKCFNCWFLLTIIFKIQREAESAPRGTPSLRVISVWQTDLTDCLKCDEHVGTRLQTVNFGDKCSGQGILKTERNVLFSINKRYPPATYRHWKKDDASKAARRLNILESASGGKSQQAAVKHVWRNKEALWTNESVTLLDRCLLVSPLRSVFWWKCHSVHASPHFARTLLVTLNSLWAGLDGSSHRKKLENVTTWCQLASCKSTVNI